METKYEWNLRRSTSVPPSEVDCPVNIAPRLHMTTGSPRHGQLKDTAGMEERVEGEGKADSPSGESHVHVETIWKSFSQ